MQKLLLHGKAVRSRGESTRGEDLYLIEEMILNFDVKLRSAEQFVDVRYPLKKEPYIHSEHELHQWVR